MIQSTLISLIKSKSGLLELGICICIFFLGWKTPSSIINLNIRDIPYQLVSNNNDNDNDNVVILDLSLNNPVNWDVTFPSSLLIGISLWFPMLIIILTGIFLNNRNTMILSTQKQNKYTLSNSTQSAICALLVSLGCSEFITQILKLYIGRLRPNFYSLCEFDVETRDCTASDQSINEARMSFPSGHSSLSFSGLGILCFYLIGRFGIFNYSSSSDASTTTNTTTTITQNNTTTCYLWKKRLVTIICLSPLLLSTYAAASRIVDNWHHPSDVLAGVAIGLVSSFCTYHMWFSFVFSSMSGIPLSNLSTTTGYSSIEGI